MPSNDRGRDFIIGDIHGYLESLVDLIQQVRFDPTRDRLFSVGDMVDRGPDSLGVLELAREPWFFAVKGNHEHYLAKGLIWPHVGAEWFLDLPGDLASEVQVFSRSLPHVIVVAGDRRFNIVHAQLSAKYVESEVGVFLDADIDADFYGFPAWILPGRGAVNDFESELLEGRALASRVARALTFGHQVVEPKDIAGLSTTYCGHTRLPAVGYTMSHIFLDTGADSGGELTMIEHATGDIFATRT